MSSDCWRLLGAPWDCSGTGRGEALAPTALRAAGLARMAEDLGDCSILIRSTERDVESGVLALQDSIAAAQALRAAVELVLRARDGRLLVVGGDCSMLLGIIPAVRHVMGRSGLWFVDGHADYTDAHLSATGETADMDLACLTGDGPTALMSLAEPLPVVAPLDVAILGHRTRNLEPDAQAELDRLPHDIHQFDADAIRHDPSGTGKRAADALADRRTAWLHIDLDVLDAAELPAVTYPLRDGPRWDELGAALEPIVASRALVGMSVADFRPDLDPDGALARRIVRLLEALLSPGS